MPTLFGPDQFDIFWKKYPRKVGKGQARKAWVSALKRTPDLTIIAALTAQLATGAFDKDRQYIPHPSTWLNQDRWDDEIVINRQRYRNGATELSARIDEMIFLDQQSGAQLEGPADD